MRRTKRLFGLVCFLWFVYPGIGFSQGTESLKVVVSSGVDFIQNNVPIELKVPLDKKIDINSIKVIDSKGQELVRQVETQYKTEAGEPILEIIWQTDLKPKGKKQFVIRYKKGTQSPLPEFSPPDENLGMRAGVMMNSFLKVKLAKNSLNLNQVSLKTEGKEIPLAGGLGVYLQLRGLKWQGKEDISLIEKGPIRFRVQSKRQSKNGDLISERFVTIYANRPEIQYRVRWLNKGFNTFRTYRGKGGEMPYIPRWFPMPGGRMSTPEQAFGEDYVAYPGKAGIEIRKLTKLPQRYQGLSTGTSHGNSWVDFFDKKDGSGIGLVYPEEKSIWMLVENFAYHNVFKKTQSHVFWVINSARSLWGKVLEPGKSLQVVFYIYPHQGDYTETEHFYQAMKSNQTIISR